MIPIRITSMAMLHDRESVIGLQQAHADHIESIYTGLAKIPGNPCGIEIVKFGQARVFCANEDRMENRAILTGNESQDELEQITDYFEQRRRRCFVELNPGNFYRTAPFSWNSEVMPLLLSLGYRPDSFRCVWSCEKLQGDPSEGNVPSLKSYFPADIEAFIQARLQVLPAGEAQQRATAEMIRYGQTADGWRHYIGLGAGHPVSTSSLFMSNSFGYLQWGFTREDHRNQGHQKAHIRRRINDALAHGCTKAFSVTDFDIVSANNLQKCGMTLAYNYVLMVRKPAE